VQRGTSRLPGPQSGMAGAVIYSLAFCDIGLNNLDEAAALFREIDISAATQVTLDPHVAAEVALGQGQIAVRRGDYTAAAQYAKAAESLDSPEADSLDPQCLHDLRNIVDSRLRAAR
jgi:Flp pilus assembly protein TadD